MKLSPRAKMLLVMGLFALPIGASYVAYHFVRPEGSANYGELLLPPRTLPAGAFPQPGAAPFRFGELSGRWALIVADAGACPDACQEKLATIRQVRLATGREAMRVARVLVADDGQAPPPAALAPHEGTTVVVAPDARAVASLDRAHIYLADPHGNVMMRWRAPADRKRMYKDLSRLLKASQIG